MSNCSLHINRIKCLQKTLKVKRLAKTELPQAKREGRERVGWDRIDGGWHPAGSRSKWQSDRWRRLACVFVCVWVLGDGGLPVPLKPWQVRSPFCQRPPAPSPSPTSVTQSPTVSFIPSWGPIWSVQPPYALVRGRMCGNLKIPICCPWLCARGAGNGRLQCRTVEGFASWLTSMLSVRGHYMIFVLEAQPLLLKT